MNAPVVRGRKGEYGQLFRELRDDGFTRVEVDGEIAHASTTRSSSTRSQARHRGRRRPPRHEGRPAAPADRLHRDRGPPVRRARSRSCWPTAPRSPSPRSSPACTCGISMPEIQPRIFSFNNPHGACPACHGLGSTQEIDPELVVPDHTLSINQGALLPFGLAAGWMDDTFQAVIERYHVDPDTPWQDLPARAARPVPQRHARPHRHALPQLRGPLAPLQGAVPRHPRQPQAPLRRDRIRPHPPEDRGVHERASVRGVPRRAPQADEPRGHGRRAQHLPSSRS